MQEPKLPPKPKMPIPPPAIIKRDIPTSVVVAICIALGSGLMFIAFLMIRIFSEVYLK